MRTLKQEEIDGRDFLNLDDARHKIGAFIEQFSNQYTNSYTYGYTNPNANSDESSNIGTSA